MDVDLKKGEPGTMLDETQQAPTESRTDVHGAVAEHTSPSLSATPLLQRRSVQASLGMLAGGVIAFVFWTLPPLSQLPATGGSPIAYIVVFMPTMFAVISV